jgi:hypothetical protein
MNEIEKIKGFRHFGQIIKETTKSYAEKIKADGGYDIFLRANIAHILLLLLVYSFLKTISPWTGFLGTNSFVVVAVICGNFAKKAFQSRLPLWINHLTSGDIFHNSELPFLNKCIAYLLIMNFLFLIPSIIYIRYFDKLKAYLAKQIKPLRFNEQ